MDTTGQEYGRCDDMEWRFLKGEESKLDEIYDSIALAATVSEKKNEV
jgi:hypothetical protein